ncbi:MAG TPA: membrane protein insertase YidC, partial [Beijerinckiaceae bacterium]|nr:membrane protein insertase YidC [Beijerinckiaceae bacterium]
MSDDNKNLFLAIGLSLLVIIGWNWFYGVPKINKAHEAQTQAQLHSSASAPGAPPNAVSPASPAANPENPGLPPGQNTAQAKMTRAQALAASPRVTIDTKSLSGSIALRGGMIDDVSLKGYRETIDPHSPHIVLLSPMGAPNPYYVETGFVAQGTGVVLPNENTLWTASSNELTANRPVTLTWDNGHGLIFHRTIAVDNRYMFTVTDHVDNKSGAPVTLFPYSLISRHGTPKTAGYAVLFEGFVGVIGNKGLQEITYPNIEKEKNDTRALTGTGGWLGFTDKYWATALIPPQSQPFVARFSATGTTDKVYQTDTRGPPDTIQPGATGEASTHVFAGAKEVQTINTYEKTLGIKRFDLMIDWGWFYFITKPMFQLLDL